MHSCIALHLSFTNLGRFADAATTTVSTLMFVDHHDTHHGLPTRAVFNFMVQGPSAADLQAFMLKLRRFQVRRMARYGVAQTPACAACHLMRAPSKLVLKIVRNRDVSAPQPLRSDTTVLWPSSLGLGRMRIEGSSVLPRICMVGKEGVPPPLNPRP